jgi:hypothetical protein
MSAELADSHWLSIISYILSGTLSLFAFVVYIMTNYRWRQYEEWFSIPSKHAAETAPLAAIIGWGGLCLSIIVARSIVLLDARALLFHTTMLFHTVLFVSIAAGTKIPKKITLTFAVPCTAAMLALCFVNYQHKDWKTVSNSLYMFLILTLGVGFAVTLLGLHWRTREQLIAKVSKADKKIKTAQKWFFFGAGDIA